MPDFIPGRVLSRRFYTEAVRPILDRRYPALPHSAAHIGPGSDVLGFDTAQSMDHDWGPTVTLFLRDKDAGLAEEIRAVLSCELPHDFHGYPVDAVEAPGDPGVRLMRAAPEGPVQHRVRVLTLRAYVQERLAYDLDAPLEPADWLTFPSQRLLELTAGPVHHDGLRTLTALRERLAWYPHDVWLYLLAAGWQRIGQDEHLMPRAGQAGDELGSAVIGARLVRDVMRLGLLMERRYAPYAKWLGTAFKRLRCAAEFTPLLHGALRAETWMDRTAALGRAYQHLAHLHTTLDLTEHMPVSVSSFHTRPFQVMHGEVFAAALCARIGDPDVRRIAARTLIGSVDQWSDSTDLLEAVALRPLLRRLYA